MKKRTLLGVLTPSSNTVLEPLSQAIVSGLDDVTVHFGRFRVTEISLDKKALNQFNHEPILEAAQLLSDAQVNVIVWSGTAAGWLGFQTDEMLCAEIESAMGIPAATSVLALNEIFEKTNVGTFGLVTPYLDEIQEKIIANYQVAGFECVASKNLRDKGNFSFSEVTEDTIETMIREAADAKPDAITVFCTNLRGAGVVDRMEKEIGIPIYDTVSTAIWKSMKIAGASNERIKGWGRLFTEVK